MTTPSDDYATAVLQGCLASLPNAASVLSGSPSALNTFMTNVQTITAAALAVRDASNQQSAATPSGT
jgi:hypothetical protein